MPNHVEALHGRAAGVRVAAHLVPRGGGEEQPRKGANGRAGRAAVTSGGAAR
ncbi:MAG: hypothetical protein QOG31_180 [Thermoplasmata archaeon]|jgi:hypothetical protein|nr:hypothetical protein [Thermoplasmata archaeon]